jgi:hypothetical protein
MAHDTLAGVAYRIAPGGWLKWPGILPLPYAGARHESFPPRIP